jgi:tetratricopeptide (TPR) repeat protein
MKELTSEKKRILSLYKAGDLAGALGVAETLADQHQGDPFLLKARGTLCYGLGKFERARDYLEKSIAAEPNDAEARNTLALVYRQFNEYKLAEALLRESIEIEPRSAVAYLNLSSILRSLKRYDEALEAVEIAASINPNSAEIYLNKSSINFEQRRYDDAESNAQRALQINNRLPGAYTNLGNIYRIQGKLRKSKEIMEDALSKGFRNSLLLCSYGKTLSKLDLKEKAEFFFKEAVKPKENNSSIYLEAIIDFYIEQNRHSDAKIFYSELLSIKRDSASEIFNDLYLESLLTTQTRISPFRRKYRIASLLELLESTRKVDGAIAECGCARGLSSLMMLQALATERTNFLGEDFEIYDSFSGLSEPTTEDLTGEGADRTEAPSGELITAGRFSCNLTTVKNNLKMFPAVTFYPGWIPNSFPLHSVKKYRFVNVDVDLYHPTRDSLEHFWSKLEINGILVCDDYNWPGAKKAVDEFARKNNLTVFNTPYHQAYLKRTEI